MRENTPNHKKKLLAAGIAVALGAGVVGVGATWEHRASVLDNRFSATVSDEGVAERQNAVLSVEGDAIDKAFDPTKNHDEVVASWTIENIGGFDAQFAANFTPGLTIDPVLARNLQVFYTVADQPERRAGTMAEPIELTAATGLSDVLAQGASVDVTVRIVLPNPAELLVEGVEADDVLNVVADWDVQYLTIPAEETGA